MLIVIETFIRRTEKDKMSVFGRRDNLLASFTLITGLVCCLTGIDSKLVSTDTRLDPDGEGVCNKTKLVEKDVTTAVSYVTSRQTRTVTCGWGCLGGSWCAWCSAKTKTVYRTAYRMETRPTMSPVQVLGCCEGYIRKDSFCVPDCMKSDCTKNCTDCSTDHSYCNRVTGVCHCKPGYYHHGNGCQACPRGWYGQNCTHRCQCRGNLSDCNPQSGVCSCQPGKAGPTCDDISACEPERWGQECDRYCNCSSYPCDPGTGVCLCGAGRAGTSCENAAISNASETDQQTNTNNAGSDVIIPVVSVLGVLIIAMVIIGVVFYRKRRMVKRDEPAENGTGRVNAAYSPDGLPHAVLPSSGIISNCNMRENDIYAPGGADMVENEIYAPGGTDMVEYDKLNFQGHFKKSGQGHQRQCQGQNIYSNPQMESDSSGMVENELYSMD